MQKVLAALALSLASTALCLSFSARSLASSPDSTVMVVEASGEDGYVLSAAGSKYRGPKEILDHLAQSTGGGRKLILLFEASAPAKAIQELLAMTSKAGLHGEAVRLFLADEEQRAITEFRLLSNTMAYPRE